MSELDQLDPNYDAHLSAVDTRTANRLMALDPEERRVDELGVPLVHIGLGGSVDSGTPSTSPNGPGQKDTMLDHREVGSPEAMRNVMDYRPGQDDASM